MNLAWAEGFVVALEAWPLTCHAEMVASASASASFVAAAAAAADRAAEQVLEVALERIHPAS